MRKIIAILLSAVMILTAAASLAENDQDRQTVDTVSTASVQGTNGHQPPAMPDGGNNQQNGQQPPAMPGNDNNQQNGQQPPAMPDGGNSQQNGQQPPAMPDGDSQNQPDNGKVTVQTGNNNGLRMRREANRNSTILGTFSNGTEVEILEVGDEWVKVRIGDKTGYMMVQFLEGDITASSETQNGQQPPAMPDGGNSQQNGQQPPAMPDGGNSQQNGQQPPAMPEGRNNQQNGQQPPEMPGGNAQGGPGGPGGMPGGMPGEPGGMEAPTDYAAATELTENSDSETYTSTADSENAVLVSGSDVTLSNATVSKTGSSNGESADFYGVNATVLAKDGATLTVSDTTVTSDGAHANGIFSYGTGTTVNVSNTTITTTGNNSGGLMTTGGATMNATNVSVSTSGNSSAAIRSDRGGGTVNAVGGDYATAGVGSPAIYSTADISVSDATLSASNSEAVVIEGGNSVNLTGVDIAGNNATLNGQSTQKTNVLIYQSMSGDASMGASEFTMTEGTMTAETGSMFHVTNTTTTINLENVDFTYASDSSVFLDASADSWGSSGSNGGKVTLNLTNQAISGAILSDSVSSVAVNLDSSSTWTLQGDSYISSFTGNLANVDLNGYTLYIDGVAVTK